MNRFLFSFTLLISSMLSHAQKNDFGNVSYIIPPGYTLIKNDKVLTYYKEDKSTGAYCNFFIYDLMPGKGSVEQDFDFSWSNLVQNPFKFTGTANRQPPAAVKGWQFLIGTTNYSDNGVATLAMLITFSRQNNMQSVCILSNADKYKNDIEDFIGSVDITGEAADTVANTPSVKPPAGVATPSQKQPAANPSNDKGPKPEVWMKSRFEYDVIKRASVTKYEWIAIYPDGKFNSSMPTEGYAGFYNKNKDWGKASWSGSRLDITDASNNSYYFDRKSASTMQSKFDSRPNFYKSKPVDGLRIEGAYTEYASLIPSANNEAQYLIWFYKDGSFDDRGLTVIDLKNPYAFADIAPGKGKYTIENFSIILRYADGRIRQLGFSGFLDKDPATVTDAYFIGRNLYYRKDKGFNSQFNN